MARSLFATAGLITEKIYNELLKKSQFLETVDKSFEGTFDRVQREIQYRVYEDPTVHSSTIKEKDLKPKKMELIKGSTITLKIEKFAYTNIATLNLDKYFDELDSNENTRKSIDKQFTKKIDTELACAMASGAKNVVDFTGKVLDKDTVGELLKLGKAKVEAKDLDIADFEGFASSQFMDTVREAKLTVEGVNNNETFAKTFMGKVNEIKFNKVVVNELVKRDSNDVIEGEHIILKTRRAVAVIIPLRTTEVGKISLEEVVGGGDQMQTIFFYDFFNPYPNELIVLKVKYTNSGTLPTITKVNFASKVVKD